MSDYPSQLRRNRLADRWVLIAPGRARRPHDIKGDDPGPGLASAKRDPFEPENIKPDEVVDRITATDSPDSWLTLALTNVFPLVGPGQGEPQDLEGDVRDGYGAHELVIHSPHRNQDFEDFAPEQTAAVLELYEKRYVALSRLPGIEYVQIFTNRGNLAGASLAHPHSQIIAFPIVPPYVKRVLEVAQREYASSKQDVIEDEGLRELKSTKRIVAETDHFVAYCPYAPSADYHVRIYPKKPAPHFSLPGVSRLDLAGLLGKIFSSLSKLAYHPAYNAFIRTAPVGTNPQGFRWHIDIVPHISTPGGFELATDLLVLTVFPETAADQLRQSLPDATL